MPQVKRNVRAVQALLEVIWRYTAQHLASLTGLIKASLRLPARPPLEDAPMIRRLSGMVPPEASIREYQDRLEKKHGR